MLRGQDARRVIGLLDHAINAGASPEALRELEPAIRSSRFGGRVLEKPQGHAGDSETIRLIYENVAHGDGFLGTVIDRILLDQPAAQAVRNRRPLMKRAIEHHLRSDRAARVTSLASGPAEELFDVCRLFGGGASIWLDVTCIDIDAAALARTREIGRTHGIEIRTCNENLGRAAARRRLLTDKEWPIEAQDLIYSIGLIDYFGDAFVIGLLEAIYDALRPGGTVVLGNFHPRNPTRRLMESVLDWPLIHRDEQAMENLFASTRFGKLDRIEFEPLGINLFAFATRADATRPEVKPGTGVATPPSR